MRVFFMLFALTEARISSDLLAFFMIIILTKPRYFLAFFIEKFKQIALSIYTCTRKMRYISVQAIVKELHEHITLRIPRKPFLRHRIHPILL